MKEQDVQQIMKAEQKWLTPPIIVSMITLVFAGGGMYSQVLANRDSITDIKQEVDKIDVIQNEITHIKESMERMEEQRKQDKVEILEAIKHKH